MLQKIEFGSSNENSTNLQHMKIPTESFTFDKSKGDMPLIKLGNNYTVYLRWDSSDNYFYFVTIKSDSTESKVTIQSVTEAYVNDFQIKKAIRILDNSYALFIYRARTGESTATQWRALTIHVQRDGTISKFPNSTGTGISAAKTATYDSNVWLIKSFFDMGFLYIYDYEYANGTDYYLYTMYFGGANAPFNSNTQITYTNDKNALNYIADPNIVNQCGGCFFRNSTDSYIALLFRTDYQPELYKYMKLTNAEESGFLAQLGVINHYVVGMTLSGFIVTTQIDMSNPDKYVYHFYLWYCDAGQTKYILMPYNNIVSGYEIIEKPAGTKLLSFQNDVMVFSDLTRYQIKASQEEAIIPRVASIKEASEYDGIYTELSEIGPESNRACGVYIYGE